MKSYIFITVVLTTALSGYGDGSTDGEICSASSSGEFRLIEGDFSCGDEEEIKKTIYEAVKNINPDIELSIEFETRIYQGPESSSDGTLTQTPPTVEGGTTTTEASITPTSTPKMTTAVTTEDGTVIQTTKQETSTATTPEMTTLRTEKTTADIQTTQMVTTQLVKHNGSVFRSCTSNQPGPHFWVSVHGIKNVTFEQGRQICQDCDSVPAVIPDKDTSLAIHQATLSIATPELWTGTTIDPRTGTLSPSYSYWEYGSKKNDASNTKVSVSPNSIGGIMKPLSPAARTNGIVCWKPKS